MNGSKRQTENDQEFGLEFAQQANRLVRSIGQGRAGVKMPGSPDLLETIGLCQLFRGSLNTPEFWTKMFYLVTILTGVAGLQLCRIS